ncbi:UBIQUITIN-CONJUGAT-2 domain-containing protein [Aphelenchoides besseyi]|nr:UBIQUITIN-CONJUGAT-2 domain-containing protein [Aphelenchoides besseyi]KAI6228031.1 UBIQUITIN-CONJUGAT-2 domain-containing protein [Aphelenchoides besseyi]
MGTGSNQTNLTAIQQSSLKSVSQKRVKKELEILLKRKPAFVKELIVDPKNARQWKITILPNVHPFNLAAFRLSVNLHEDYPFKPPHLLFITSIWHPNINTKGEICASILQIENWKPSTTITAILEAVLAILDNPDVGRFINEEAAEMYVNNRQKFVEKTMENVKKNGEKR